MESNKTKKVRYVVMATWPDNPNTLFFDSDGKMRVNVNWTWLFYDYAMAADFMEREALAHPTYVYKLGTFSTKTKLKPFREYEVELVSNNF
jgi:hypothetical protein